MGYLFYRTRRHAHFGRSGSRADCGGQRLTCRREFPRGRKCHTATDAKPRRTGFQSGPSASRSHT